MVVSCCALVCQNNKMKLNGLSFRYFLKPWIFLILNLSFNHELQIELWWRCIFLKIWLLKSFENCSTILVNHLKFLFGLPSFFKIKRLNFRTQLTLFFLLSHPSVFFCVLGDDYLATWLIPFSESAITVRTSAAFGNLAGSHTTAATYKKNR